MAPTFEKLLQSHQFTFLVGEDEKPIVVHADAIAETSEHFYALIHGGMKESETRCASVEDVKFDDFVRFCESAYRGDYTVPQWNEAPSKPRLPNPSKDDYQRTIEDSEWGFGSSTRKKGKKGKKGDTMLGSDLVEEAPPPPEIPNMTMDHSSSNVVNEEKIISRTLLRTRFNSRRFRSASSKALILDGFLPKPNTAAEQDFAPVLLAHARLYSFAHFRLVTPLRALTLKKIHRTLMCFKLFTNRVQDIVELARYAYSDPNLPDRSHDGKLDDLRELVLEYILCEIDTVGRCDEFVHFMEEGGEFVGDFWKMARDYIN